MVLKQSTNGTTWTNSNTTTLNANSISAIATGLTNGQEYHFKLVVVAGNEAGDSNSVTATPTETL